MTTTESTTEFIEHCPVGRIRVDPINPRTHITVDDDFVASIAAGILEPLIVRVDPAKTQLLDDEGPVDFLLVAGHRRHLAAIQAELPTVPVVVRHDLTDDRAALVAMIVENGQREDLPPLDEARGIETLVGMGMTQREAAKAIGREQGTVSKRLSLLKLPQRGQQLLEEGRIGVKTALGLTGLVKHNDRMSGVLDYASKPRFDGELPDERDLERRVAGELEDIKRDKERAQKAKELAAKIESLRAGALHEIAEDEWESNDFDWEDCGDEDENAAAFHVMMINGEPWKLDYFVAPHSPGAAGNETRAGGPLTYAETLQREDDRKRRAEATEARKSLRENLCRDGYPGGDTALAFIARMMLEQAMENDGAQQICELLDLTVPEDDGDVDESPEETAVRAYPDFVRAAFADALGTGSWAYDVHTKRLYLQLLVDHGYQPLDEEQALLEQQSAPGIEATPDIASIERRCRVCGCTDEEACEGGCTWVADPEGLGDVCSSCVTTSEPDAEPDLPDLDEPWAGYEAFGQARNIKVIAGDSPWVTPESLNTLIAYETARTPSRQPIIDAARARLAAFESVNA